ncbi:Protein CBG27525 [Caenorhabditis briggsae]|uniref:Protein CBG27525 n=1 Tax=Caenorhabditis briggsae TaxID=6238 RepID=B6IKI6_CAEBR|nr:Protein CBG27525 [Caenorhabditis briggsae]CAS00416.1 Protein CBG27525 [Caenorhabditis briggsae]
MDKEKAAARLKIEKINIIKLISTKILDEMIGVICRSADCQINETLVPYLWRISNCHIDAWYYDHCRELINITGGEKREFLKYTNPIVRGVIEEFEKFIEAKVSNTLKTPDPENFFVAHVLKGSKFVYERSCGFYKMCKFAMAWKNTPLLMEMYKNEVDYIKRSVGAHTIPIYDRLVNRITLDRSEKLDKYLDKSDHITRIYVHIVVLPSIKKEDIVKGNADLESSELEKDQKKGKPGFFGFFRKSRK